MPGERYRTKENEKFLKNLEAKNEFFFFQNLNEPKGISNFGSKRAGERERGHKLFFGLQIHCGEMCDRTARLDGIVQIPERLNGRAEWLRGAIWKSINEARLCSPPADEHVQELVKHTLGAEWTGRSACQIQSGSRRSRRCSR